MAKYRKKPVEVEAIQWDGLNLHEIIEFVGDSLIYEISDAAWQVGKGVPKVYLTIKTLEGKMDVSINDYVIKGVAGEFYPCKPDIFKATYEKVDESLYRRVIVFAKNMKRGIEFLEGIVGELKYKDIETVFSHKNLNDYCAVLTDGTVYQVVFASDTARGYKCTKAYIEKGIDEEIIERVIKPSIIMSDLPKEEQVEYFE